MGGLAGLPRVEVLIQRIAAEAVKARRRREFDHVAAEIADR